MIVEYCPRIRPLMPAAPSVGVPRLMESRCGKHVENQPYPWKTLWITSSISHSRSGFSFMRTQELHCPPQRLRPY